MSNEVVFTSGSSLKEFSGDLVLVGHGKMGDALLEGWIDNGLKPSNVVVFDPARKFDEAVRQVHRINPENPGIATAIVLAVKPQIASNVLGALSRAVGKETLVLSVMAGKTLSFLEHRVPAETAIVRAMPNMPAAIRRGITVAIPNARVSLPQRELARRLLASVGFVEWIDDESLMDAVTAVSGSGPAYVFLLAESLTRAGIAAGLPPDLAAKLARETVAGSGELLHRSALDPATLRQNVTSPGGTTAAALEILMAAADGLDPLLAKAIAAAAKRSRELAG